MHAIPTTYGGVRFRSRLEARWAAFFDQCKWPWDYEPLDLHGYIPDFVLSFRQPVLVEVKPLLWDHSACERTAIRAAVAKIESSGWTGRALLVGARLNTGHIGVVRTPSGWNNATQQDVVSGTYGNAEHVFRAAGNATQWMPNTYTQKARMAQHCYCGKLAKHTVEGAATMLCDRCVTGCDADWHKR